MFIGIETFLIDPLQRSMSKLKHTILLNDSYMVATTNRQTRFTLKDRTCFIFPCSHRTQQTKLMTLKT